MTSTLQTITVDQFIARPPERVWAALTTPELLARWWAPGDIAPPPDGMEAVYNAMTLGLRDYVRKNGFPGVVIGMSGGIDSALSAAVAVDALGSKNVHAVMMPSPYTSRESLEDAEEAAKLMGIRYDVVPIEPAMKAFGAMLKPIFADRPPDTTEENIQARLRMVTLMALSNKFGHMLLTTGNKSEMSVGYATLYGDMAGGYSVLKDAYKTTCFALSRWRNSNMPKGALGPDGPVMPQRVIEKPPSAELRPNQKDEDSLPPYDLLDRILEALVEKEMSVKEAAAATNADIAVVADIERVQVQACAPDHLRHARRQRDRAFGRAGDPHWAVGRPDRDFAKVVQVPVGVQTEAR